MMAGVWVLPRQEPAGTQHPGISLALGRREPKFSWREG